MTALIDVRCLQDSDYARRGVGRHALALLRGARPSGITRLLGLCDPSLPGLIDEAKLLLDATLTNAYAAQLSLNSSPQPAVYVSLSPMTHDPLFAGRLLGDTSLRRIAVVYDFIPHREPSRYLPTAGEKLDYAISLKWLGDCDLFAPISQTAATDLSELLRVRAHRICVTGAALDAAFDDLAAFSTQRCHILVVGGGDPRKNPEMVIRAHARSGALQSARVKLVVAGNYSVDNAKSFSVIAEQAGGDTTLLVVPGHVAEHDLLRLYAEAGVVVAASRDEGFSLPVVEGMAAGAVVIASNIPAHAELVSDPSRLFSLSDDLALSRLLGQAWSDQGFRSKAFKAQAATWPYFRSPAVTQRFWSLITRDRALTSEPLAMPAIMSARRPKVAILSPLPPDRSGVADYTAATCAAFSQLVELHVFTETERPLSLQGIAAVRPLDALPCLLPSFDRVIGVIGNSHFHLKTFQIVQTYGGAVIAHDARMLGFYRALLGEERALKTAAAELGRPVTVDQLDRWSSDERHLEALFLGDIARAASPMFVHSPVTAKLVQRRHGLSPICLPFSIYRPWRPEDLYSTSRAAARQRLGLSPGEIVIATFGYVHATKAPEDCIWALEILRRWGFPASLHFIGGVEGMPDNGADLLTLADSIDVGAHVTILGRYVSEQFYRDYLAGADLGVQLRTFGMGGLSGALLDCAAVGLPTVANEGLFNAVEPPPSYTRVIPDSISPLLLAESLADLIESGVTSASVELERRAFNEERSPNVYARKLMEGLELDIPARYSGT